MPKPESGMRKSVLKALRWCGFHAEAVENGICSPGTPDVSYCGRVRLTNISPCVVVTAHGEMELKCLDEWPKRSGTNVKVHEFTNEQRMWLRSRWKAGGVTSLLLRVGNPRMTCDWLLFKGPTAADVVDFVPKAELFDAAATTYRGFAGSWLAAALGNLAHQMD